jgi:predicted trehalose synthase
MGSSKFHGSAGELGTAIKALHEAMAQRKEHEEAA